nr:odorant receptor 30 [Diaphania glauculalis]
MSQASRLSTSIFHSGWELIRTRRQFRALAVLAIMSSQKPVHMTAFGVITLSHRNFISVRGHIVL